MSLLRPTKRQAITATLVSLIFVSLLLATVVVATERTALDEEYVRDTFEDENVYTDITAGLERDLERNLSSGPLEEQTELDPGDVADRAITAEYTRTEIDRNIRHTHRYLRGDSGSLELSLDLTPIKSDIEEELNQTAQPAVTGSIPDQVSFGDVVSEDEFGWSQLLLSQFGLLQFVLPVWILLVLGVLFSQTSSSREFASLAGLTVLAVGVLLVLMGWLLKQYISLLFIVPTEGVAIDPSTLVEGIATVLQGTTTALMRQSGVLILAGTALFGIGNGVDRQLYRLVTTESGEESEVAWTRALALVVGVVVVIAVLVVAVNTLLIGFGTDGGEGGTPDPDSGPGSEQGDVSISLVSLEVDGGVAGEDELTATVTLENTGDATGTRTVVIDAGLVGTESADVTLEGGDSTTRSFELDTRTSDAGEYTVSAAVDDSEVDSTVTIADPDGGRGRAELVISNLGTNSPVTAGENLTVTVGVTNTGNASGTRNVTVTGGALGSASNEASIAPGNTTTVSLDFGTSEDDAGAYEVTAGTGDDEESLNATVVPAPEPSFEVSLPETNISTTAGNPLRLTVRIENTGDAAGTRTVEVDAGRLGFDNTTLFVDTGGQTIQAFSFPTAEGDAGEYEITVGGNNTVTTNARVRPQPDPPFFSIDSIETNESVTAGEDLPVAVVVRNTGDLPGNQTVQLSAGQLGTANRSLSLLPNESTEEMFRLETNSGADAGEYTIAATSDNDSARATVTVEEEPPGEFMIENLDVDTPSSGGQIEISVGIRNTGGETATRTVEASVSVFGSDSTEVTLTPNQPRTVDLAIPVGDDSAGEFVLTITTGDDSRSLSVSIG